MVRHNPFDIALLLPEGFSYQMTPWPYKPEDTLTITVFDKPPNQIRRSCSQSMSIKEYEGMPDMERFAWEVTTMVKLIQYLLDGKGDTVP